MKRHAGFAVGVSLLALFAYSNSLRGAFVFDDIRQVRDNPLVHDLGGSLASWSGYRAMPNRFIGYATFALNYRLGGLDVTGYHLFNLGVHVAAALMVYALVVLVFRTPRVRGSAIAPASRAIAFAAAALFVTHPLQTEAVTYIVQRLTSLATFFYVASVALYAAWRLPRAAGVQPPRGRRVAYVLALAAAIGAMRTKEIAFTLPVTLALFELSFFGFSRKAVVPLLPFLATALLIPATLVSFHATLGEVLAEAAQRTRVQATLSRLDYLTTEIVVVASYLRLSIWPIGQNLDHDVPIYRSILEPRVLGSLAVLASLLAAAAWLYRRTSPGATRPCDPAARLVAFGIGWFFLTLLVESSVIPIADVMYEHRVYLPSVGLFTAAAAGGALLLRRIPRADAGRLVALAALPLALLLAVATLRRNVVWTDDVSLWADAASKSPGKARPFHNLGSSLAMGGHPQEAIGALRRAISLDPVLPEARAQLGSVLLLLGRMEEAEPELREAVRLDATAPEPLFNLAMTLWRSGRRQEAKAWFERFLEVAPAGLDGPRRIAVARARE